MRGITNRVLCVWVGGGGGCVRGKLDRLRQISAHVKQVCVRYVCRGWRTRGG